jgi:phosphoglycerate kinase
MFRKIKEAYVKNRVVFLRADMNVSMKNGKIMDDTRIRTTIPTIEYLVSNKAKIVLATHLGKANGEGFQEEFSIMTILRRLESFLPKVKFHYAQDCIGPETKRLINSANFGDIILLENLRFHKGEEANDENFAKELASLAEIYVNDAFSTCHRSHASMVGIPKFLKSYAGLSLEYELDNLERLTLKPERPLMVIVGGSKVSTKLNLLKALVSKADYLAVGGGMANTFLFASNISVGNSLKEAELQGEVLELLQKAQKKKCKVIIPKDVVTTKKVAENQATQVQNVTCIAADDIIVDVGPKTIKKIQEILTQCKMVIWNGPVGIYEISPFNRGTDSLIKTITSLTVKKTIKSIAGGGDILTAINASCLQEDFTYISTAGGAFLQWLEKGELPAIEMLKN